MSDILQKICATKRAHIEAAKKLKPLDAMHQEALRAPPVRGFLDALRQQAGKEGFAFITEIKKASPSAGVIRPNFSPVALARAYAEGGAACLSVLTDEPYFQGKAADLMEARDSCSLPVLRKDFMLDVWQVAEARAMGADCILLIMAVLDDETALSLAKAAWSYDMDALVEVHDRNELERALKLSFPLIGVNSRNLKTLEIDLEEAAELLKTMPSDRFAVSESGMRTPQDIAQMRTAGARGFLVGEALLKQDDVQAALQKLKG